MIKVTTENSCDFLILETSGKNFLTLETLEKSDNYNWRLRVYSVDGKLLGGNVTMRNIDVATTNGKNVHLSGSSLSYDSNRNIFLSDFYGKAVHVLSVNGQYHCQLLSSHQEQPVETGSRHKATTTVYRTKTGSSEGV